MIRLQALHLYDLGYYLLLNPHYIPTTTEPEHDLRVLNPFQNADYSDNIQR